MLRLGVAVSLGSTSFLFLIRVRAVYLESKRITSFFGVLWLIVIALVILTNVSIRASMFQGRTFPPDLALIAHSLDHFPSSRNCALHETGITPLPSYAVFVYDSLVFLAITCRLAADAVTGDDLRSRVISCMNGKGLHRVSKALLKSGQLYYL